MLISPGGGGELHDDIIGKWAELAAIYVTRGVECGLADHVAPQLIAGDSLGIHAPDLLGLSKDFWTRPVRDPVRSRLRPQSGSSSGVRWRRV